MSEFLYLYRGGERQTAPAAMQQQMQRWMAWLKELGETGHLKSPGHPLENGGKVLSGRGAKAVTDGPFAEKDMVGGVEVRPIQQIIM